MINKETGRLLAKGQTVQVPTRTAGKTFLKRDFLLDATGYDPHTGQRSQYENILALQATGEWCGELDRLNEGDLVAVSFVLQGRKWTDRDGHERRLTDVRVLRVEAAQADGTAVGPMVAAQNVRPEQYAQQAVQAQYVQAGYGQPGYTQQPPQPGYAQQGYANQPPQPGFPPNNGNPTNR